MTRQQAKDRADAIRFWGNGGNLWSYCLGKWVMFTLHELDFIDENSASYIMEDRYFEARKAHALGEPIEVSDDMGVCDGSDEWIVTDCPSWNSKYFYRPKRKEWYDDIPAEGILCWVNTITCSKKSIARVIVRKRRDNLGFKDNLSHSWDNAVPVKPEELWKGVD